MAQSQAVAESNEGETWGRVSKLSDGMAFFSRDGRRLEVCEQTGDEWSAELFHKYGCTRLFVRDTEEEVYEELVSKQLDKVFPLGHSTQ